MFFTYVTKSNTSGKIYIWHTSDIEKRLLRHNKVLPLKKSSYVSRQGKEWKVIYIEKIRTRREAMQREKELKSGTGREFLKNII